jgi:hypothetical protein
MLLLLGCSGENEVFLKKTYTKMVGFINVFRPYLIRKACPSMPVQDISKTIIRL